MKRPYVKVALVLAEHSSNRLADESDGLEQARLADHELRRACWTRTN
jgi:hypothetical protein